MTSEQLATLRSLTRALHLGEEAKMRELVTEEEEVRQALARLEEHVRHVHDLPEARMSDLRRIGADVTWQGWVSQNRRDLQIRLARVLARKGLLKQKLKRSFGRDQAVSDMAQDAGKLQAARLEKQSLLEQQSLFCLQLGSRLPRA